MVQEKNVLTTGEVAKICNVAPRTVSKWFDSGQLRGYRIPGSKDRRIPLEHLIRFMRTHGIPLNGLDSNKKRILVLDADVALGEALKNTLTQKEGYEVSISTNAFEAGAITKTFQPSVLLVDVKMTDVDSRSISRFFRSDSELRSTCLIGTAQHLIDGEGQALLQQGFDGYLAKPFATSDFIHLIETQSQPIESTPVS